MKSIKKMLSVLLTVLMIFSAFSVSASAEYQTVEWDQYGDKIIFTRAEDVTVGENTFSYVGNFAHRFTAEKEGIYSVTISVKEKEDAESFGYSCLVSSSSTDTTATDFSEFNYSGEYETVYYFEAGESQFIGAWTEGDIESYTLKILYLGKAANISVKDADRPLQGNYDICLSDGLLVFLREIVFQTDLGNDVCISDIAAPTALTFLKAGEVSADITALGISRTVTFSVFFAQDEIEKVTPAEGFEAPTAYVNEKGELTGYQIDSPSLSVNIVLWDGTVIANEYAESGEVRAVLADGREIVLMPDIITEDGKTVYYLGTNGEKLFKVSDAKAVLEAEEDEEEEEEPGEKLSLFGIIGKILDFLKRLIKSLSKLLPFGIIKTI